MFTRLLAGGLSRNSRAFLGTPAKCFATLQPMKMMHLYSYIELGRQPVCCRGPCWCPPTSWSRTCWSFSRNASSRSRRRTRLTRWASSPYSPKVPLPLYQSDRFLLFLPNLDTQAGLTKQPVISIQWTLWSVSTNNKTSITKIHPNQLSTSTSTQTPPPALRSPLLQLSITNPLARRLFLLSLHYLIDIMK